MSLLFELAQRVADLERQVNDSIVDGVVHDVRYEPYRVCVNYGTENEPILSDWLPAYTARAGLAITWWPLEIGEAVMILSPNGDTSRGRVYPAGYTDDYPQPDSDPDRLVVEFGNDNYLYLDRQTGKLLVNITDEIELNIGATNLKLKVDGTVLTTPSYDLVSS